MSIAWCLVSFKGKHFFKTPLALFYKFIYNIGINLFIQKQIKSVLNQPIAHVHIAIHNLDLVFHGYTNCFHN